MREILFRGKRKYNGEWVQGDLWCNPYGKRVICIVSQLSDHQSTTGGVEVIPETVGQYTGLTDKNGKRIFEGDIVKCSHEKTDNIALAVIKYGIYTDIDSLDDYDYLGWHLEIDKNCISILSLENDGIEMEVIGNIYDNPELLEVGK